MLHQYYGSHVIENLGGGGFSPLARIGRTASHGQHLDLFPNLGFKKSKKFTEIRGGSLDLPSTEDNGLVRINVSGKIFDFKRKILEQYPESLLAKRSTAGTYYDFDRKDYFFDRSRIAFDSIYHFYQTHGCVVFPDEFPEQLVMDEFYFFGLYDYLDPRQKQQLVKPSESVKEEVVPKQRWQLKLWQLLDRPETNNASKVASIISLLVIVFSIIILCVETLPSIKNRRKRSDPAYYRSELFVLESFCIIYFTIEIILRFIASPIKLKFWFKVLNVIDLIAILPYYLILAMESDYNKGIVALRVFRLARAFRILKVSRYVSGMKVLGQTLREALSDLWMVAFLTVIGTLLFASCVFYFEQIWDPTTQFESIPLSLWWSIVTISTVGYGDMAPKTLAGKLVGSTCAISGVLLIAPLLPIIYERWQRYYQLDQEGKRIRAGHKLLRDLQKKKRPPKTLEDMTEPAKKENADKQKRRERKTSETRERKISETKERARKPVVKMKEEKLLEVEEIDERADDDIVWKHIRRASLKRRESSQNLMRRSSNETQNPTNERKRPVNGRSRKGKDIVAKSQSNAATEQDKILEEKKETEEEIHDTSDEAKRNPLFHVSAGEGDAHAEKSWDEPGPSNVKY